MKVFGIVGTSGSGKTTLIERLLPRMQASGLRVSVLKHTHHDFDLDQPGKDSYRHRAAGAVEVLLAGGRRWVLMHELRGAAEPTMDAHLAHFSPCDLVLVEGFKRESMPKLEVFRPANGKPALWREDRQILAVASNVPASGTGHPPWLDLDDAAAISRFIIEIIALRRPVNAFG